MKLLKFTASWCSSCKQQSKVLEDFTDIPVEEIDVEDQFELADEYGIRNLPTMILLDNEGKEKYRFVGVTSLDKIRGFLNE